MHIICILLVSNVLPGAVQIRKIPGLHGAMAEDDGVTRCLPICLTWRATSRVEVCTLFAFF